MPSTLKYAITYPSGTAAPNVPLVMQTQAESVEAAITAVDIKMRHAEFTTTAVTPTAGTSRNIGTLSADAALTFNNTFCTPGTTSGTLKITEAGVYAIDFTILPVSTPGNANLQILGVAVLRISQASGAGYGSWELTASTAGIYFPANEIVAFNLLIANAVTCGGRIRVTKLHA